MTEIISVGFRIRLQRSRSDGDTDILIVHQDSDPASCRFVLACKRQIVASVAGADVTMLTRAEEAHLGFIEEARATLLGNVHEDHFAEDLSSLKRVVLNAAKC